MVEARCRQPDTGWHTKDLRVKLTKTLLALALGAAMLPATAAQFDFYKLGRGLANGDFLPNPGAYNCTGGDKCSSDVANNIFSGSLSYTSGGITATATAQHNGNVAAAVQDHDANWSGNIGAGLGVYHMRNNSDDNITNLEKLIITFDRIVRLTSIGLRAEQHNYTFWDDGATFLFDGTSTPLPKNLNGGTIATDLVGQQFSFEFGGAKPDQFYLSSMTAFAIPEPESWALSLAALAAMGVAMRRRANPSGAAQPAA